MSESFNPDDSLLDPDTATSLRLRKSFLSPGPQERHYQSPHAIVQKSLDRQRYVILIVTQNKRQASCPMGLLLDRLQGAQQ